MDKEEREVLFCEHAKAVLRNETSEAQRLRDLIYPDQMFHHYLFTTMLFSGAVAAHLGDDLDRTALRAFMTKLRHTWRGNGRFRSMWAEAMIRSAYDEPELVFAIPQDLHNFYRWAALAELIDPTTDDQELEAICADANTASGETFTGSLQSGILATMRDGYETEAS